MPRLVMISVLAVVFATVTTEAESPHAGDLVSSSGERDLTRGVLAFNANKSVYLPTETAYLQMGVVDEDGRTICDAELDLTVTTPTGEVDTLSTENGRIRRNPECGPDNVIEAPDYFAYYATRTTGTYDVALTSRTLDGVKETRNSFEVREDRPFDIERIGPSRVYPVADYRMQLRVKANQGYQGTLREYVPSGFVIRDHRLRVKSHGRAQFAPIDRPLSNHETSDGRMALTWKDIALTPGDELEVTYTFNTPNTSPEFYLLGGVELADFVEARSWQIAVDSTAVFDTFTETVDTPITAHTPDTGSGWTTVFDDTGGTEAEISETTDIFQASQIQNNVGQAYTAQPTPTTVNQNVSITLKVLDTTSSDRSVGIFARRADNSNFYHVQILPNAHTNPSITLYKFEGGVPTILGTFDAILAVGTVIKLEVRDVTKKVFVDGVERISSSDNSLTAAGTWGVYFGNFNGAGIGGDIRGTWDLDDFLAEDGNFPDPQSCARITTIGAGDEQAFDMIVQPDGRFILVGYSNNGSDEDIALARYHPDGRLDLSFDGDGIRTDDIGTSNERARAVALQSDGKIVVAGYTDDPGNEDWFVARYDTDGSLDPSFGGGIVTTAISGLQDRPAALAIQPDGKIVVSGYGVAGGDDVAVVRYNTDGSVDPTFSGGIVTTDVAVTDRANDVKIQSDGKIVVGGTTTIAGDRAFLVIRYNSDGSPDNSFGASGVVTTQVPLSDEFGEGLDIQPDGKIVLGGFTDNLTGDFMVARYDSNGTLDSTFGTGGIVTTDILGGDDDADDLLLQPDGKILVAGYAHNGLNQDYGIVRYNSDGSLDTSFGTGGKVTTPIGSLDDNSEASALLPDGSFIVAGFSANGSDSDFSWARHNPDGSLATGCGVVNYRSIGTAGNYTDGTGVAATSGSTVVTGIAAATWKTSNRGRGDLITIDGVPYTVLSVDSETQLTLTSPYTEVTGSGKAYTIARKFTTLPAWEECVDATTVVLPSCHDVYTSSLTADDRNEIGIAYADTDFVDHVLIQGASTDADHFITLTADAGNRHLGIANGGVVLDPSSTNDHAIEVWTDYTRVEWLEITGWEGNSTEAVRIDADLTEYEFLLIHGGPETSDSEQDGIYVGSNPNSYTATIRNTIVYRVPRAGIHLQNHMAGPSLTLNVENVTLYDNGFVGIDFQRGGLTNRGEAGAIATINAKNVLSVGNTNNDYTTIGPAASWGSSDNNLDSDGTAQGTNPVNSSVAAVMFVSDVLGTEDLHIQPTSSAENTGADLSGSFSLDIDGGTRPAGQWDIGADEESAAASSLSLANHASGQVTNKFTGASPITDTWFQFRLTSSGTVNVDAVRVGFTTLTGVLNGDVTNGELWEDTNGNGTWDDTGGGDTLLEGSVTPSGGILTFSNNFPPGAGGTNYFVRASVANLVAGNSTVFSLDSAGIDEVEASVGESGSITNALHSQSLSPSVNYRSVGTNSAILYQAGTASISAGSNAVTFGGGASLPVPTAIGAVGQGDKLVIGSETFFILSRDSNTQVTIQEIAVSNHAGEAYTITRAYNTLQDWEDDCVAVPGCLPTSSGGRGGDLVTDDRYEIGVAYNDVTSGAFIDNDADGRVVRILGSTVDATHHRDLTVAVGQRHNGTAGTGAVVDGQTTTAFPIQVSENDTRVEWLEVKNGYDVGDGGSSSLYIGNGASSVTNVVLEYMLVYDYALNFNAGARPNSGGGSDSFTVRNSIFYNGEYGVRSVQAGDVVTVENCTSYNMSSIGYHIGGGGVMSVTNSIATVSGTADFSAGITGDYNLDQDGSSAPGANSLHGMTAASQFVSITLGSEDLHLKVAANAIDAANPTPLSFCCDIDGGPRIGSWDIGADEFGAGGAGGCGPELQLAETASSITVTAPNSFEMTFDLQAGGGIQKFYDLAEDPGRNYDLAGSLESTTSPRSLHNLGLQVGGNFHNLGENDAGSTLSLLEATPTRVRIRQDSFYEDGDTATILVGAKGRGDYSIYPSGRLALRWNRTNTATVNYATEIHELVVHEAVAPLDNWGNSSSTDDTDPNPGTDSFVLAKKDVVGVRTDFLHIISQDWSTVNGHQDTADEVDWASSGANERVVLWWAETDGLSLSNGDSDSWSLLTYFKPTNFGSTPNPWQDPEVTGRRDDYRVTTGCPTCGPDDLASPAAPTAGAGWFHASENTVGPSDFFNESEAAYTLDFDMAAGLTFDIDGGLGTPPVRYSPFFKIRQWRSFQDPETVTVEGTTLSNDVDFRADVKPVSRAHFASDLTWYSTLQSAAATSAPAVGTTTSVSGAISFVGARYGSGASIDANGDTITFPAAQNFNASAGTLEFWYRPSYECQPAPGTCDGTKHVFWHMEQVPTDYFAFRKTTGDTLQFETRNSSSGITTTKSVALANFGWRAEDWVHLRVTWDSTAPVASDRLMIYVNGVAPTQSIAGGPFNGAGLTVGPNYIGTDSGGGNHASGILDELRVYNTANAPTPLAHGGLTSSANEYLASTSQNFQLAFDGVDVDRRGEYAYFGADSQFRGLNIGLSVVGTGVGAGDLVWEYWNGTTGAWDDLEAVLNFTDETDSLTKSNGTVYWEDDPANWAEYSVNGSPDLFYVRAHLVNGASYGTPPTEALIKTDILLFQYCSDITQAAQTFSFAVPLATAVELVSFEALPLDGAVALEWKTGSELDNLGFHLYRAESEEGQYTRITTSVIPGLGSSPQGATYNYRDSGLSNGVTYYYKLEDIETTGAKEFHGPVSATPTGEVAIEDDPEGEDGTAGGGTSGEEELGELSSRITYGDPSANELLVRHRGRKWMELTLITEGFYAIPQEDGSVLLEVPGFEDFGGPDLPDVPAYRTWQDVLAGRDVKLASVKTDGVAEFASLRPSSSELIVIASGDGTVQTGRRRKKRRKPSHVYYPESWAKLMSVGFQGAAKKALVEMAPLRWDATAEKLVLARRLVVRIAFKGKDKAELQLGKSHREVGSHANRSVYARIAVTGPGLYGVSYESVFGQIGKTRKAIKTSSLRLSRQGEPVAFFVSPNSKKFKKKSVLYFLSDGADLNPYGHEAVYELEASQQGLHMESLNGAPVGAPTTFYWKTVEREENLLYQAAFEGEEDIWQWDWLFGPMTNGYPFEVTNLSPVAENSKLRVWLHGASDFPEDPDHHVRLYINGILVNDTWWDGETPHFVEAELGPGLLLEGENTLEIEEVGDTEAQYSMVMLDRFEVSYPSQLIDELDGSFTQSGLAIISGGAGHLFDVTEAQPKRLSGVQATQDGLSFGAASAHRYLLASSVLTPEVRPAQSTGLKKAWSRAEYLVIGPREFLDAAEPLLAHRRNEGLIAGAIATEDIFEEFGYGEATPESIKDFLSYVYHHWSEPTLRYVVLLGDGTYDFKDYLATGVASYVPVKIVETRYMWTASDPWYGAINGDDILPDVAIGRLPAASVGEVQALVQKILDYESGEADPEAPIVLITDNPDVAGNFDADAEELASTVLKDEDLEKIYLSELGASGAQGAILSAFDQGASLMSYMGHGAIHLWAQENLLDIWQVGSLAPQSQQPLLFTMNCLNGYFHFPYFNSLSEELLKAEGKGVIAAFSPTGLSLNSPAHRFHKALLQQVVHSEHERLGDAILAGQTGYAQTGAFPELLTIYHLLGDPGLKLR